jgi:hypothetical protein
MHTLHLLLPDAVGEYWHLVKDRLQQAISHGTGESTLADWLKALANGNAQLWILLEEGLPTANEAEIKAALRGALITQFLNYNRYRTLHLVMLQSDDFSQSAPQYHLLEAFGKRNNCVAIEQWGRPGWARALPKYVPGFKLSYHVMKKTFD